MTTEAMRWRRIRWMVRTALAIGVAASVAANVLHAQPNPIAQAIAAWPPLALLLTVELVGRVPVRRRLLGVLRLLATTVIAGIAAWVSYGHMAAVVARYGETTTAARLLPVSVDGLIVVASICLVELSASPTRPERPTLGPAGEHRTSSSEGDAQVLNADTPPRTVSGSDVDVPARAPVKRAGGFGVVHR